MSTALGVLSAPAAAEEPAAEPIDSVAPTVTVTVRPQRFSPNGDGRKDVATIAARVSEPATLTVQIRDAAGVVVRRWPASHVDGAPLAHLWNGRKNGTRVPDGRYVAVVTAQDAAGLTRTARAPLFVDTRPPRITLHALRSPTDASTAVTVRYRIADASPKLAVTAALHDSLTQLRASTRTRPRGYGEMRLPPRYRDGTKLLPGGYRVRLAAVDLAGNRATSHRPLVVHRPMKAKVIERLEGTGRKVALTFDDCHFPISWGSILDTLRERGVTGSFFCPGELIRRFPDLGRRTVREGHVAASHGWDHTFLTRHSYDGVASRLLRDRSAWMSVGATSAPYFRPPYGAFNSTVVAAAGATAHPRVMMWDIDSRDTAGASGSTLVCNVVCKARPGSIILLHTKPVTAAALPAIISGLRRRGLEPVGLPELFRAAGYR